MNDENKNIVISKKSLAIIIICIIILIASSITVALNWNNWFEEKEITTTTTSAQLNADIDPNAKDLSSTTTKESSGSSTGIKIPGYPSITIQADTKDVTMSLVNPEGNPCYFTFEIVLDEKNETIYTSKQVPPGKAISDVTLTRALPAGEYNATIKITTNSTTDMHSMNGANVETILIVK